MKDRFTDELIRIKRSRKQLKDGDIFVIQPKPSVYYYGKVIKANMTNDNINMDGMNIIYIYNQSTDEIVMPEYLDPNKLLIQPEIVNRTGWTSGYFYTIGNMEVTQEELNFDCGFCQNRVGMPFVDLEGKRLNHIPKYRSVCAIGGYGIIAIMVKDALEKEFKKSINELISIKKSHELPKEGDIFVIKLKSLKYLYGKVIKTNIQSDTCLTIGMNLVYIYGVLKEEVVMPEHLDLKEILTAPMIVDFSGWEEGCFYTIGNMEVTEEELNLDYGFWMETKTIFFEDEEGNLLKTEPKLSREVGLYGYEDVSFIIKEELEKK